MTQEYKGQRFTPLHDILQAFRISEVVKIDG